jgi:two-component system chemotaxis response regulator CheY
MLSVIQVTAPGVDYRPHSPGPVSGPSRYPHGAVMRFLMVDDSSTMRRIIINTLNQLGYTEVVEASKGRKGIDKSNVADADMVITDWNMPEMNGIEFIRTLRGLDKMKDTPILMVTTNAAKDDIVEALRVGVNNYIVKRSRPTPSRRRSRPSLRQSSGSPLRIRLCAGTCRCAYRSGVRHSEGRRHVARAGRQSASGFEEICG